MFPDIPGTTEPSVGEFIHNPQFRQVASFFLGTVFMTSMRYIALSPLSSAGPRTAPHCRSSPGLSDEKSIWSFDPCLNQSRMIVQHQEFPFLTFFLNLCVALASSGHFISVLVFSTEKVACAFSVAWGNMAAQLSRLIALIILFQYLRSAGMKALEYTCSWVLLLLSLGLAFGNTAVSVGILKPLQISSSVDIDVASFSTITLCYRKQFLPTSLATSIVYILLEVYVLCRFLTFYWRTIRQENHKALHERLEIWRISTLLILEMLTIVPSAVFTSILTESVLYCLGILLVLFSFNASVVSPLGSGVTISPKVPHQSSNTRSAVHHVYSTSEQKVTILNHPYSCNHTSQLEAEDRQGPRIESYVSNFSGSAENAVVQEAYRNIVVHPAQPPLMFQFPQQQGQQIMKSQGAFVGVGLGLHPNQQVPSYGTLPKPPSDPNIATPSTAADRHLRVISTLLQIPVVEKSPTVRDYHSSTSVIYGSDIVRAKSSSSSSVLSRAMSETTGSYDPSVYAMEPTNVEARALQGLPESRRQTHLSATGTFGPATSSKESISLPDTASQTRNLRTQTGIIRSHRPSPLKVIPAQPLQDVVLYSDEEFYNV
jgi:hypothetical protein